jgi:carbon storage regulator
MLVLTRRPGEEIVIGTVRLTVVAVAGNKVRLGVTAPAAVPVHREEIRQRLDEQESPGPPPGQS